MENGCLERDDFFIGREFWTETGRWRFTEVGIRIYFQFDHFYVGKGDAT